MRKLIISIKLIGTHNFFNNFSHENIIKILLKWFTNKWLKNTHELDPFIIIPCESL